MPNRDIIDIIIQERGGRRVGKVIHDIGTQAKGSAGGVSLLRNALRGLGAGFAIREVLRAVDSYQRMQNQLRVTGLETSRLAEAQGRLFSIAQKTRTPMEETVNLYGKLAQASGELGKSQEDMLRFTELTGKALAIQGTSVQGSRSALLQLSQAMGEGIVRAQEYNSLIENARPLLLAAAQGMEAAGGSVARLRTLVLEGTVTSKAFFDAVLAGGHILDEQFGKTVPTISQALVKLRNGWTQFIGESHAGQVILASVSGTLILVSENIETIATVTLAAGAAIATYLGGPLMFAAAGGLLSIAMAAARYVAVIAVLTPGLGLFASAQLLATSSSGALAAALGILLSPVAILAVTVGALTAAWLLYGGTSGNVQQSIAAQDAALGSLDEALKGVDQSTASGIASTRSITTEHYRAARAALESARAEVRLALARAEAASNTLNPFDDISALSELQRVYQLLLDTDAQVQGLELHMQKFGLSVNESGNVVNTLTGALVRTQKEINALHGAQVAFAGKMRAEGAANLATAKQLLTTIQAEAQMQRLITTYGEDSLQVANARQAAERAVMTETLRTLGVSESVTAEILAAVDSSYDAVAASNAWAGAMANVAAQVRGIAAAIASIGGGLISQASRAVEINALRAGATAASARRTRVEADIKAETQARLLGAKTVFERGAILFDQGVKLRGVAQQAELVGLQKIAAERDRANGGGGGGRAKKSKVELTDVQNRLKEIIEATAEVTTKAATEQDALTAALNNGVISADQYAVGMQSVRLYAAEAALENTNLAAAIRETNQAILQLKIDSGDGTFADGFLLGLARMTEGAVNFSAESGAIFSDYFSTLADGVANSIGRAIVYSEDLGEALSNVAKEALAGLISAFVKMGIQWLINAAIGKSLQSAATAATVAQAGAAATAWAPAAALASLATSGANAAPAAAALASTTALSVGIAASSRAISAFADGGEVRGPGGPKDDAILAYLSNREFVVNAKAAQANMPLLQALNKGFDMRRALPALASGGAVASNTPTYSSNRFINDVRRDTADNARGRGNNAPQPQAQAPDTQQNFVFLQDPDLVGQYMQTDDGRAAVIKILSEEGVI